METRKYSDGLGLISRKSSKPDSLVLALVSNSIVLAESIVLLVSDGFCDEAFGLCRTLPFTTEFANASSHAHDLVMSPI
jgi:hypothetical protein